MGRLGLDDPAVRLAYLATKAVVVLFAAGLTWLLVPRFGPRLWVAWAVFAGAMGLLALVVLSAGSRRSPASEPCEAPEPELFSDVVELPIEDALDLHPFPPAEIPSVVDSYLEAARESGFREVRLIHGKGIGVQRERVRSLLSRHPLVVSFADAPPERGGWGATIALLKDDHETSEP